jgi:hypothetical protein
MSKMPPVPPEQRSNKGPGSDPNIELEERDPERENFDTQGSPWQHQAEHDEPGLSAGAVRFRRERARSDR